MLIAPHLKAWSVIVYLRHLQCQIFQCFLLKTPLPSNRKTDCTLYSSLPFLQLFTSTFCLNQLPVITEVGRIHTQAYSRLLNFIPFLHRCVFSFQRYFPPRFPGSNPRFLLEIQPDSLAHQKVS